MSEAYQGSCHCGAIGFQVAIDLSDGLFVRCNCSLCSAKNRGVAVVPASDFVLLTSGDALSTYRWNTKREEHHFCQRCGIHTHHTLAEAPARIGVNLACIRGIPKDRLTVVDGDGASLPLIN